jgi:tight adherence protein C
MPIIVWLAAAMLSAALPVAWWALSSDRNVSSRVAENLADYQPTMRQAVLERSATERFLLPLARQVGRRLVRFTPVGWVDARTNAIARAGWTGRLTAEQVLGTKLLLPLVVGAILGIRLFDDFSARSLLLVGASVTAAFFIPDLLVRSKADRRAEQITLQLPDVLDQLTISVEAGLGFEAALGRITASETHPLAVEFGRMLQDIRLGTARRDALEAMAERSQVDDLKTVVLTLRQAELLGVPLAQTLRAVSTEMREKRRFRAEERANTLPIKMIFPLGVCILPALFIVILGPAIVRFFQLF